MEIAAILLTLGVTILVGLYLYAPFFERQAQNVTREEHELSALLAERDRVVTSLQELDFDFKLGKIPEEDYPTQRTALLQKGAGILRSIDAYTPKRARREEEAPVQDTESRIEEAVAARRAGRTVDQAELADDEIESMISARRRARKNKSAGFCTNCGKPVLESDRFCPSCGKSIA